MLDHIDDGNHMMFVRLQSNGLVRYQTYARLSSYCPLDVKMFPFDHQICMMMFSSWTMDSSTIQIISKLLSGGEALRLKGHLFCLPVYP